MRMGRMLTPLASSGGGYRAWTPCSRRSPPAAAPWWSRLRRSSPRRGRCGRLPMSTRPPGCVSTAQRCSGRGSSSSRQVMAGRPDRPDMAGQAADWPRLTGARRGLRSAGRGLSRLFLIVGAAAAVRTAARGAAATSKWPPWQRPSSALVHPQGAPGGSSWLDTLPGSSPAIGRRSQAP